MYAFIDVLGRLNSSFRGKLRFLAMVDFITIAVLLYGVFFYFDVEDVLSHFAASRLPLSANELLIALSLLSSAVLVLFFHRGDRHRNVVLLIEERYPALQERLRTAWDNRERENVVMRSLSEEVLSSLRLVRVSALISQSAVVLKLVFAGMVILGSMFVTVNEEHVSPETLSEISDLAKTLTGKQEENGEAPPGDFQNGDYESTGDGQGDIYGKPKIARLSGTKIDLLLYSGSGVGLELRSAEERRLQEFEQTPVYPVDAVASGTSDDYNVIASKSGADKLLIRRYALEMNK
jgi:hypothetical protein